MTRRLIREGDPPAGQLASPVPQYWNPNTETFEDVLGAHGAPRAILYGPNGQPIGTQTNPLEVRVRDLEAKLDELKQTIESGVQLKGHYVDDEAEALRVKTAALGWKSWNPFGETVLVPAGTFIDSPGDVMSVNGFGTLGILLRRVGEIRVREVQLFVYWQSVPGVRDNRYSAPEEYEVTSDQEDVIGLTVATPTKSQYVGFRLRNRSDTDATYHFHAMLRAS